jgi:hypothetical protein
MNMTLALGLPIEQTIWAIRAAGIAEILFGLVVIMFYKSKHIIRLNIMALVTLLVVSAVLLPSVITEAFNPVTTNIPLIVLSVILLARDSFEKRA